MDSNGTDYLNKEFQTDTYSDTTLVHQLIGKSNSKVKLEQLVTWPRSHHNYIRGYHAYMESWIPVIGQILLLRRDPTNVKDSHAVAVFVELSDMFHLTWHQDSPWFCRGKWTKALLLLLPVRKSMMRKSIVEDDTTGLEVPCVYI